MKKLCDLSSMKCIFAAALVFLLSACGTSSVSQFKAPDGSAASTIKCSSDTAKCFVQASQSCQSGGTYRVISSQSNAGGLLADIIPGPVTWYSMTIVCGAPDGKMPDFKFVGQQYIPPTPPVQVDVRQQPTTTSCTKFGNSVNCTTR